MTPDRAEEFVKQNKEQGADYIKLMQDNGSVVGWPQIPTASLELQKAIVSASHRHNLLAVAHATNMEDTMLVLHAGVDGLAHTFLDQPPSPELIDLYRSTNAFLIPTLSILASITGSERSTTAHFASSIPDPTTKATMCDALNLPGPNASISHAYASVRALKAAGIDIVAGTDAVPGVKGTAIGPSLLQELYLYVERCGLSAVEALRSATGTAARRFGFEDRGRIEVGRRADLVLVRGNPVAEGRIEDLRRVVGVWKEGVRCI